MTDLNEKMAKFMGWTDIGFLPGGNVLYGCPPDDYNKDYPNNKHREPVPLYDTDLKQAMMVVKRLHEEGYFFEMGRQDTRAKWYALFWVSMSNEEGFEGQADTPALAICRAVEQVIADNQKIHLTKRSKLK